MESGDLNVATVETVKYETVDLTSDNTYTMSMPSSSDPHVITPVNPENNIHIQQVILEPLNAVNSLTQVSSIQMPSSGVNTMNFSTAVTTSSQPNIQLIHSIQPPSVSAASVPPPAPTELYLKHVLVDGQSIPALVDAQDNPVSLPVMSQQQQHPTNYNGMSISPKRIDPLNQITSEEEQPLYVNAKQYQRILKRRQQRAKLEAMGRLPRTRQKYMYESRHQHAVKRARKSGGKFGSETKEADNSEKPAPENNITYCHPKILTNKDGKHMLEVNQIRVITSTDSPTSHAAIQSLVDAL